MVIHRGEAVAFEPVRLDEVVRQAILEAIPLAEPGIDIDFRDTAGGATISGDTVMPRAAVQHLLDNVVRDRKSAVEGESVTVRVERGGCRTTKTKRNKYDK